MYRVRMKESQVGSTAGGGLVCNSGGASARLAEARLGEARV